MNKIFCRLINNKKYSLAAALFLFIPPSGVSQKMQLHQNSQSSRVAGWRPAHMLAEWAASCPLFSFCFAIFQTTRQNTWMCVAIKRQETKKKKREKDQKRNKTVKLLRGIFRSFLHLVLDVPWHALFTFEIGKKDFQIIQLKLYPSRDPMPFLSSAYWAAPTEKKHLTALTVNEANFVLFIKAPFWRW